MTTPAEKHVNTIWNETRSVEVVSELEWAKNPWTRFKGLMCRESIEAGYGLWIEPCSDVHSFFMRFEFDALFLNKESEVLHRVERMKPNRISKWVKGGRVVLELPAGTIAKTGTQVGDQLVVK